MQNEINELRNQVRTLKRMLFGVFGVVVVGGLLAATSMQGVPDVIQAKKFEVVNDEGKVIVELSNLRGGGVDNGMLVTRTSAGGTLVKLASGPSGGRVATENGEGQNLVVFGGGPEGGGELGILNKDGKTVAGLLSGPDGGSLGIFNNDRKLCASIGSDVDGGMLDISNKDGKQVVGIYADADGGGEIVTMDSKGQPTSKSP
jgi:hypothetical protein